MKQKIFNGVFVMVILAGLAFALHHYGLFSTDKISASSDLPLPNIIQTEKPERRNFSKVSRWFGSVKSRYQTRISALVSGRIISVSVKDEMPVVEGELLFTIGGPLIDSRREVLNSQLTASRKRVTLARQVVKMKETAVARKFEKHEELDKAKDTLIRLKAELESGRRELERLDEVTQVRAAMEGVFTRRKVAAGQEVKKGDELAEIISQKHLYIVATVFPKGSDDELEKKKVFIDLSRGKALQGVIVRAFPRRTKEGADIVWIEGHGLGSKLRPGQSVSGTIIFSQHQNALSLPTSAVARDEKERAYIFLSDSSGYHKKSVKTGMIEEGRVEITSGLKEEDQVVVQGAYELLKQNFNQTYKVAD